MWKHAAATSRLLYLHPRGGGLIGVRRSRLQPALPDHPVCTETDYSPCTVELLKKQCHRRQHLCIKCPPLLFVRRGGERDCHAHHNGTVPCVSVLTGHSPARDHRLTAGGLHEASKPSSDVEAQQVRACRLDNQARVQTRGAVPPPLCWQSCCSRGEGIGVHVARCDVLCPNIDHSAHIILPT